MAIQRFRFSQRDHQERGGVSKWMAILYIMVIHWSGQNQGKFTSGLIEVFEQTSSVCELENTRRAPVHFGSSEQFLTIHKTVQFTTQSSLPVSVGS